MVLDDINKLTYEEFDSIFGPELEEVKPDISAIFEAMISQDQEDVLSRLSTALLVSRKNLPHLMAKCVEIGYNYAKRGN